MKGDYNWLYIIIVALIITAFIIGYSTSIKYSEAGETDYIKRPQDLAPYNYEKFVLAQDGFETSSEYKNYFKNEEFCDKLKNAIMKSVLTNTPQEIDTVVYIGTGLDYQNIKNYLPDVSNCDSEQLQVSLGPGIKHNICYYDNNMKQEDEEFSYTVKGIDDLNFKDCAMSLDKFSLESILASETYMVHNYYSPEYFNHYSNTNNYNLYGNGPGIIKLKIDKAAPNSDGNCKFILRTCPQMFFAEKESESIFELFDIFRKLELFNYDDSLYYIKRIVLEDNTEDKDKAFDYKERYEWTLQKVELTEPYTITQISSAIITGLSRNPYDFMLNYDEWNIIESGSYPATSTSKNIIYNCGSDNLCEGEISIYIILIKLRNIGETPVISEINILVNEV